MLKYLLPAAVMTCLAGAAFAEADAKAGKRVWAVVGFRYSKAMAASGIIWSEDTLAAFVANPKDYVEGNKMSFSGLKKEKDIANLIAYLKEELE